MSSYLQFSVTGCHFIMVGGDGGGRRVTGGVVFINSLLSPATVFSYWSDISQIWEIFTAYKLLLIVNYNPHKFSLKWLKFVRLDIIQ